MTARVRRMRRAWGLIAVLGAMVAVACSDGGGSADG
jgi:hypothetical protein